ncbi:MAG: hydroxymethylbilane synthase [Alphaproteobacteria bacterium]|nr:hydroxymethylbilane synthase [Alphaproteobacteria bacterium]|tara:strand:- start:1411 stop:2331 length:921 start_codon:yes stop_codon:yes gene_type:complete
MNGNVLRIGTRGSPLALYQANLVRDRLAAAHQEAPQPEVVIIRTTGDAVTDRPLADVGGKGMFTKEIDTALLDGAVDLAVHSAKDMETWLPVGIAIGAALEREDPRDVLIGAASIDALPRGGKVGTASLRRQAQLLARRPDLEIVLFRGNVDTRLRKLAAGEADATLLAHAGLRRLGKADAADAILDIDEMLPAAGQGVIAVACRAGDETVTDGLEALNDATALACLQAERAMLDALDGTCRTPIGALARLTGEDLRLAGLAAWPDGRDLARIEQTGTARDPETLGRTVGEALRERMGSEFFKDLV